MKRADPSWPALFFPELFGSHGVPKRGKHVGDHQRPDLRKQEDTWLAGRRDKRNKRRRRTKP